MIDRSGMDWNGQGASLEGHWEEEEEEEARSVRMTVTVTVTMQNRGRTIRISPEN